MFTNSIIMMPLSEVLRSDIALSLRYTMHIHTVGSLVAVWNNRQSRVHVEHLFDSPEQARHAVTTCAAWMGIGEAPTSVAVSSWWRSDALPRPGNRL